MDILELEIFEIKYSWEGFEERNNFLHRNFFKFELDFKWKTREASRFKIQSNLLEFLLRTSNLNEIWTKASCLHLGTNSIHGEEFEV
jgi:hypothetical protein